MPKVPRNRPRVKMITMCEYRSDNIRGKAREATEVRTGHRRPDRTGALDVGTYKQHAGMPGLAAPQHPVQSGIVAQKSDSEAGYSPDDILLLTVRHR